MAKTEVLPLENEALFRDRPIWQAILTMAVPSVFSILIMLIYNMTDMFFIGQLGDTAQVGAISVVSPAFSLFTAVATMIGVGGCATIAKAFGAGETDYARSCASLCGWACLLFGAAGAALLIFFSDPLLRFLGATPDMWDYAKAYMRILALGAPLMLFTVGFASLLRAEGAIKQGFVGNLAGTVTNILLDPLFILGLKLGVVGAAVATVIGNLVGTLYFLYYVFRKAQLLNLQPAKALRRPQALGHILVLGLPNAISSILSGFAATFANRLLHPYGSDALAAMGAAGKVTMLITMVQMGICMGVQPLMAYNYGAKNIPRLKEVLQKLAFLTIALGAGATLACSLARHMLIGLFLKDAGAAAMGEQMVVWLLIAGPTLGLYYLSTNFLQASGNAWAATVVSVLRQGVLLIPSLYLMHALLGFTGIAAAHTAADIASAVIALSVCLWQYRRLVKNNGA